MVCISILNSMCYSFFTWSSRSLISIQEPMEREEIQYSINKKKRNSESDSQLKLQNSKTQKWKGHSTVCIYKLYITRNVHKIADIKLDITVKIICKKCTVYENVYIWRKAHIWIFIRICREQIYSFGLLLWSNYVVKVSVAL